MDPESGKECDGSPPAPPPESAQERAPSSPRKTKSLESKPVELPQFLRFKSQALCKYITVCKDRKGTPGRLTFLGKMDKTDPALMFETVHVPGLKQCVKVKSLWTNKFWKRVPLRKVPECTNAIIDDENFSVVLATGANEFDADVFRYQLQEHEIGGLESRLVSLWSADDQKFVAPFCVVLNERTNDVWYFLGLKPECKMYKNTFYFHSIYHQHMHLLPDPKTDLGKYGFGF